MKKEYKFGTAYQRRYYHIRRQRIIDYLGGKCVICNSKDCLEIDHIDPSLKKYDIRRGMSLNRHIDEINKCQILCNICHKEKTKRENQKTTHGQMRMWMHNKCCCTVCQNARDIWNAKRREKRRKLRAGG